ncbi:tetratricopeptide repeat protein [Massilia horti]|uniref:Tetratricopeptide repeat protein n=1 Tax=Massilia horti TaxID=2562153 RepID=A0A4Y9T582_9BURK|nr:tetratricopeptide repeat protein [Massilia horti]TFW35095.1 tetratricopeptide repeat protein [Massilia horti]
MRARWKGWVGAFLLAACGAVAAAATPQDLETLYLKGLQLMNEGRQQEAAAAFEQLIAIAPQHAGAWMELAMHQCALGDAAEAERLFREIEMRFAPSAGILEVINASRRQGCKPWQAKQYASFALARGIDTNVNQGASNPVFAIGSGPDRIEGLLSDDFLPKRDSYVQAAFDYTRELNQQGMVGFVQMRVRRQDEISQQDTNSLLLGLDRPFQAGIWRSHGTLSASMVTLGGKLYQRQLQLQARTTPKLSVLPEHLDLTLSAALGKIEYVTRQGFDATNGELGAQLNYRTPQALGQAAAGLLADRGESARPGGNRHGWYASAQLQRALFDRATGELGWTRQDWQGESVYSPQLIDAIRHQSTRQWRATVNMPLAKHQLLQLEWRQVHNRENISLFQYNSQALQLSWRWNGF